MDRMCMLAPWKLVPEESQEGPWGMQRETRGRLCYASGARVLLAASAAPVAKADTRQPMDLSFRALALLLAVWVDAQKTSFILRPPISGALTRAEVTSRLRSFSFPAVRERRLSSFPGVSKRFREDWQLDVDDLIEQVKVAPGRQGEAVVTWLTKDRHLPSALQYAAAGSLFRRRADGQVNVYTMQICLPNSEVMLDPLLGPPGDASFRLFEGLVTVNVYTMQICLPNSEVMLDPLLGPPNIAFDFNQLTALINSSSFLPKDSDSWRYLPPEGDPWDFLARTNYCIDYKNPKAYYTSPYIHSVTLTNLRGSTDYNFQPLGSSRRFSFRTPPEVGAPGPYKLGVWADVGVTNVSFAVMTKMLQLDPDLLLTVGDLSYADGWAERWDIFGVMMEPLMSSRYHLAVPGNHEIIQNNGIDLIHRYPMPFRESGSESPFMFAHESGPVFVIGMAGSYSETDAGSAQWVFVEEKLRQVNRARTPWVIVMFHTPWYNSNNAHYLEGIKHQWDMEQMLYNHGVDIVFNGHVHSYERSHPVFNFSKDECGITHIVVGDAGNYEDDCNRGVIIYGHGLRLYWIVAVDCIRTVLYGAVLIWMQVLIAARLDLLEQSSQMNYCSACIWKIIWVQVFNFVVNALLACAFAAQRLSDSFVYAPTAVLPASLSLTSLLSWLCNMVASMVAIFALTCSYLQLRRVLHAAKLDGASLAVRLPADSHSGDVQPSQAAWGPEWRAKVEELSLRGFNLAAKLLEEDDDLLSEMLQKSARLDDSYWICAFAVNQHTSICHHNPYDRDPFTNELYPECKCKSINVGDPGGRSAASEINKFDDMMHHLAATGSCRQVIAVDQHLELFNRAWCVAEIAEARRLQMKQSLKLASKATLHQRAGTLKNLDVRSMRASSDMDKKIILDKIKSSTNIDQFNEELQALIFDPRHWEGPATYEGHPPGWKLPQPPWSAFREASYGPGMLTVLNATHAEWKWHRVACVYENKDHHPVNLSKFTYDGSRQSLGRTRPITAYIWDGASGPSEGPPCATESDNSEQKFEASDMVMLVRNPGRCPNKGGAQKVAQLLRASRRRETRAMHPAGSAALLVLPWVLTISGAAACCWRRRLAFAAPHAERLLQSETPGA
ncbi:Purple acid phosphatase 18 [Symbiodinium microadriaticum]|uniref:Purple acid phosphatase n=1 Tax=Symbiodinium microadriaticum TaxID=2951 RepID=A0A1Q9CSQ8_SYMMI|nr:Purple acid phosphatase 18 [Symbiodinium microadriaticum]